MILKDFSLYHYDIPLVESAPIEKREGFYIVVRDDEGNSGYGEAAPLPGFSTESFEDVREQLIRLRDEETEEELLPSVSFGLEMAMMNLAQNQREIPMRCLLSEVYQEKVFVNRLLRADDPAIRGKVRDFANQGSNVIKVKAGRQSVREDAAVIKQICQDTDGKVSLRVDPNGRWDLSQALAFADLCRGLPIEYIEDPVKTLDELHEFGVSSGFNIAIDGIYRENPHLDFNKMVGVTTVVLKPTLVGGFEVSKQMARSLNVLGMQVIVSSSFESGAGILALGNLAASICGEGIAVGLDTFGYFADDALTPALFYEMGYLDLRHFDKNSVDVSKEWITPL